MKSEFDVKKIKETIENKTKIFALIAFFILFVLYVCRTPGDTFTDYLWGEDGKKFIQDAIFRPFSSFFDTCNGSYSVIQRIIALMCYFPCYLMNNISYLPMIMGIVSKSVAVIGIMYFLSDRFVWLIEDKSIRLLVCVGVILSIPIGAWDLTTCDASLPHVLLFTVYLIGVRLTCERKAVLNWDECIFLVLIAFSSAVAPFVGLLALGHLFRVIHLNHTRHFDQEICGNIVKFIMIMIPVMLQCYNILQSGRASADFRIAERLLLNTKNFVFFPFWQYFHSWLHFFLGLFLWLCIMRLAQVNLRFLLFSCLSSFVYMLYCSMTVSELDRIYGGDMVGRFIYVNVAISVVMLGVAFYSLWKNDGKSLYGLVMCIIVVVVSMPNYEYIIETIAEDRADIYFALSGAFDKNGNEKAYIPVGPGGSWAMQIPVNFSKSIIKDDMTIDIVPYEGGELNISEISSNLKSGGVLYVSASLDDDTKLINLFFEQEDGVYQGMWTQPDEETDNYTFQIPEAELPEGYDISLIDKLVFIGQTQNGELHRCVISSE